MFASLPATFPHLPKRDTAALGRRLCALLCQPWCCVMVANAGACVGQVAGLSSRRFTINPYLSVILGIGASVLLCAVLWLVRRYLCRIRPGAPVVRLAHSATNLPWTVLWMSFFGWMPGVERSGCCASLAQLTFALELFRLSLCGYFYTVREALAAPWRRASSPAVP